MTMANTSWIENKLFQVGIMAFFIFIFFSSPRAPISFIKTHKSCGNRKKYKWEILSYSKDFKKKKKPQPMEQHKFSGRDTEMACFMSL